ncbi:MAG: CHAT domain-containing protein [Solirubrobacteraceae bacterium]
MRPLVQGYDELRLRIDRREAGRYHVLASTRSAEASTSFDLPFNELEIENFILKVSRPRGRRSIDTSAIADARSFGGRLFKALFGGPIHDLYRDALAHARGEDRGVRITLCLSGSPELIDVPWEYLFDEPDFLAVSAFTPVVRYLDLPRAHRPLLVEPPLRLLGVVSSPADYEQLDVERERDNLQRALSGLTSAGAVELHWLERPTLGGLLKALQTETFHALHYIGHGSYDRDSERGVLLFEDDSGWARPVSGDRLGMVLHDFSSLRLAVLNACEGARAARTDPFAGVAGALVQRDIPAVVAMQFEISDEAAIVFAGGFYEPLAGGVPVDASLAAARLAMLAERSDDIEWGTPVLFMRVPDGRIFDLGDDHPAPATGVPVTRSAQIAARRAPDKAADGLRIFLNYRQQDTSGHALLLTDRLGQRFGEGNVHGAVDHGPESERREEIRAHGAFLALIGPGWVSSLRIGGTRSHTDDASRRELEWALRDVSDRVIPVLIDTAIPDPETLPRSLRAICRKEPVELRHASFDSDLAGLFARIDQVAAARGRRPGGDGRQAGPASRPPDVAPRPAPPRAAAGISEPYHDHYVDVINGMLDGGVVPLLGSDIRGPSPPADQLASPLSEQFATNASGLAEVAQRVAVTLGERRLYTAIKDLVAAQSQPTDVHRFLADFPGILRRLGLPPRHQLIISGNYDLGLERAFEDVNEPFDYAVYVASSGWFVHVPWGESAAEPVATTILEPRKYVGFPIDDDGQLERTIIVKIHGGADGQEGGVAWRNNYVVTEDHYIDYLPTHNIQDHLPIQILDKLTGSRCLFLGYALRNWNSRVFLRRIWRGKPITESSWAIQQDPDPLEKASWSVVGHVELLAAGLPDYVSELRSMLEGWRG